MAGLLCHAPGSHHSNIHPIGKDPYRCGHYSGISSDRLCPHRRNGRMDRYGRTCDWLKLAAHARAIANDMRDARNSAGRGYPFSNGLTLGRAAMLRPIAGVLGKHYGRRAMHGHPDYNAAQAVQAEKYAELAISSSLQDSYRKVAESYWGTGSSIHSSTRAEADVDQRLLTGRALGPRSAVPVAGAHQINRPNSYV